MTSPPAVALGREENKPASQQSKLFRLNTLTAGTFQGKWFSLVLTVKLLFGKCRKKKPLSSEQQRKLSEKLNFYIAVGAGTFSTLIKKVAPKAKCYKESKCFH